MYDIEIRMEIMLFHLGVVDVKSFEKWLYSNEYLEDWVGKDNYFKLISFDFDDEHALPFLRDKLESIYFDKIQKSIFWDESVMISLDIIYGKVSITDGLRCMCNLNRGKERTLPIDFDGYSSEIDRLGESFYKDRAMQEIERLLLIVDPSKEVTTWLQGRYFK